MKRLFRVQSATAARDAVTMSAQLDRHVAVHAPVHQESSGTIVHRCLLNRVHLAVTDRSVLREAAERFGDRVAAESVALDACLARGWAALVSVWTA